jgi:hypothetical protein
MSAFDQANKALADLIAGERCERCNVWRPWRYPFFCRRCQKALAKNAGGNP